MSSTIEVVTLEQREVRSPCPVDSPHKLHQECARADPSLNRIQQLLKQKPALVAEKNEAGKLAIHLVCAHANTSCSIWVDACFYRPKKIKRASASDSFYETHGVGDSVKIMHLLLKMWPESVKITDNDGRMPLHLACSRGAPFPVFQTVFQAFPQATLLPSAEDRYPLHMACLHNKRPEVILFLADRAAQVISQQDSLGFTPLHLACASSPQVDVIDALLSYDQGHTALQLRSNPNAGYLPIHLACKNGASSFVVQRLVKAWPEGVRIPDAEQKWLPLHHACASLDLGIVDTLVEAYPESVWVQDTCGRAPFQIAYDRNASVNFLRKLVPTGDHLLHFCIKNAMDLRFVYSLLMRCPEEISRKDSSGSLPIHCACAVRPPKMEVLDLLFSEDLQETISTENGFGDLPCHLACSSRSSLEILKVLMPDPSRFSRIPNHQGDLALHLACRHGASIEVLEFLFQANPCSASLRNHLGELPVHCLANHELTFDRAKFATINLSATLEKRDSKGFAPLHLACSSGAPLDALYAILRFQPGVL